MPRTALSLPTPEASAHRHERSLAEQARAAAGTHPYALLMPDAQPTPHRFRFLTIEDVAEELATSPAQIRALIRRKELPALQIGRRGQWRIERARLEAYIEAPYAATERELERRRRTADELRSALTPPRRPWVSW